MLYRPRIVETSCNGRRFNGSFKNTFFGREGGWDDTSDMCYFNFVDKSQYLSSKRYLCLHAREICFGGCRDIGLFLGPLGLNYMHRPKLRAIMVNVIVISAIVRKICFAAIRDCV